MRKDLVAVALDEDAVFAQFEDDLFLDNIDVDSLRAYEQISVVNEADIVIAQAIMRAINIINPSGIGGIMSSRKQKNT